MSENINFIPASELPLAEAKEVDVLCVENGELKRKAGANLGGGGYIINVPTEELQIVDNGNIQIILSESRDNFGPILAAGGKVWAKVSLGTESMYLSIILWTFEAGALIMASAFPSGTALVVVRILCPNGTWTPETEG